MRAKTIKTLEEIKTCLHDFGFGKGFLGMTKKGKIMKMQYK